MLGHVSIGVQDLERAARFYDAALLELGYVRLWTGADGLGYGEPNGPEKLNIFRRDDASAPGGGCHLAFTAPDRASVAAFHRAALASGGSDNGAPGLRPHYASTYFAAFVIDPDGYKLEAVHQ